MAEFKRGDTVASQGAVVQYGIVVEDTIPGLPEFVMVRWEDGQTVEEVTSDLDRARHTVRGQTSEDGWEYGVTHDFNCPACLASGASYTASPRSETYWSS